MSLQPIPIHTHPALAGSTLHALFLSTLTITICSHKLCFFKHSGKCFKCKIYKFIALYSLSFTQNSISKSNLLTGMYVSLPRIGQLGTFAKHKDTGITNSCFWKLHNTKPNTSPLGLLPVCYCLWMAKQLGTNNEFQP